MQFLRRIEGKTRRDKVSKNTANEKSNTEKPTKMVWPHSQNEKGLDGKTRTRRI